ncbi:MAG: ATP-binding protein [Azonexus sp.]|nr:ATP-binding protein [Azonexus sp.]
MHDLNITPWNPAPALGLVFLLRQGSAGWLSLIGTVVLSEWVVRGIPQSWWSSLVSALILSGGYIALGEFLRRRLEPSNLLNDRTSLLTWILPIAGGTLLISLLYLTTLDILGVLPANGWQAGVLQFWVGDGVGITVAMPLFWWLSSERGRILLKSSILRWETLGYASLSLFALWIAFDFGDGNGFKLFYLLFLPIVWASARQGMAGAIISAFLLQIEVIAAVQILSHSAVTLAELQILSLAMALIGFFIGSVVDEQRRTSDELKQTLRLAAAGEMAGALAHELNQPLTALAAYASACETLLERGEQGERLNAAIRGMLLESGRAGEVVRRLRDFFRTGATKLEPVRLPEIIDQAIRNYREKATAQRIAFNVGNVAEVTLLADRLQLEVVLRNLLANAFDAVGQADCVQRTVSLNSEILPGARVSIVIEDSGTGLSDKMAASLFEPFLSSKSSGLGLGLVISRAIVDTHGGKLWGEVANHGIFKLVLPIHESSKHV